MMIPSQNATKCNSPTNSLHQNLNIMLRESFPTTFSPQLWDQIIQSSPKEFLLQQKEIMKRLLAHHKLFSEQFFKFYNNHQQIQRWSILANKKQSEIKEYIFYELINQKYGDYIENSNDKQTIKGKFRDKKIEKSELQKKKKNNHSFHKIRVSNMVDLKEEGRAFLMDITKKENQIQAKSETMKINWNLKGYKKEPTMTPNESSLQFKNEDYHDLFLRTLHACDGFKYIFYDFVKHMKGIEERPKYNKFIRRPKQNNSRQSLSKGDEFESDWITNKSNLQKSEHSSSQIHFRNKYFHEKQSHLGHLTCSKYEMNPIGQASKRNHLKKQIIFRKMPNLFKRVNSYSPKSFQQTFHLTVQKT